jgi:hypothetical protein
VIGAVLALIGALIGRAVGVIPSPFAGPGQTPTGAVSIGETLRNQTLAMFRGDDTVQRRGEELGLILAIQRSSANASKHGCRIVWSFLDAKGPTTVSDQKLVNQNAHDVDGDPTACRGAARIWVPLTASLATYDEILVRVEFFDDGTRLGLPADSEHITLG